MKTNPRKNARFQGFALIVTLSLMILLTVISVGLLSLATISLRSSAGQSANNVAKANARMALMFALGELQKTAGDDRRVTADGSIFAGATHPNAVGVWKSWSPRQAESPTKAAPNYATAKTDNFVKWLVSEPDPTTLENNDWAKGGALADPVNLFSVAKNGFDLAGSKVEVMKSTASSGAFAWVVSQSATKAKINIGGPEDKLLVNNVQVQAQPRPSLGLTRKFNEPTKDWNERAQRVLSMSQAKLDSVWKEGISTQAGSDFTTEGLGLITDVVNGGLKTDLNLGFELEDGPFNEDQWAGVKNPFRAVNAPAFGTIASYKGERTLFTPQNQTGTITANLSFDPANVFFEFPVAAVPTFATLRSFYRTPYHLYNTADGPTVFERGSDHVALTQRAPSTEVSPFSTPGAISKAIKTQTGYRPVLDRILFVLSAGLGPDKSPRLVVTPIITLWNPYNTALEIEGAVAYPWIDFPYQITWKWPGKSPGAAMSTLMGHQFRASRGHGRSVNPFFYAAITHDGKEGAASPIRFQPGQVRVFAPAQPTHKNYSAGGSIRERTLFLRPVDNPDQLSARGGLSIPMWNITGKQGFEDKVTGGPITVTFAPSGGNYPFFIALEDALRAKGANPDHKVRGEIVGDVQSVNVERDVALNKPIERVYSLADLTAEAKPFGVLETYHRTALDSASGSRSDLVFTNNPRQQFMNSYVAQGSFKKSPHYENKLRTISTFDDLIQSSNGSSYYGASNTTSGQTHLSFFEVPRSPMLSLAGFQHADLSASSYAAANQFGNSWASAYLARNQTASLKSANDVRNLPAYDHSYLSNEALWDSFFFSGAAPVISPASSGGSRTVWDTKIANVTRSLNNTISDFVKNPEQSPMRNPRFRLHRSSLSPEELIKDLQSPSGCVKIAGHLLIDGAFNINSTNEDAWAAVLSGLRAKKFEVAGTEASSTGTPFPRFRDPVGKQNDNWHGYRSLSDSEMKSLATNIVNEVRLRGPFLSLGEFVNRRLENSDLGLKGALQSAIDASNLNGAALYESIPPADLSKYPAATNISPAKTGVGIPGYLTQADMLQSIASVITPRSDTFTIRAYGEARDKSDRLLAKATCEAVVQRTPDFVDPSDSPSTAWAELSEVNTLFGRRFSIVSFRYLSPSET